MENVTNASGSQKEVVSDAQTVTDSVAYETYKKVLGEKKQRDQQLAELKAQLELKQQQEAEKEGRKDEVIASLRKQLDETKSKFDETYKTFAWNTLEAQIKQKALQMNCTNPDALIRLMSDEDLKSIEVGDGFSVNNDDLVRVIDKAKKEFGEINLFKKSKPNINDVTGNADFKKVEKTPDKLSMEELKERIKLLDKQGE
jgi:hypothetical protein